MTLPDVSDREAVISHIVETYDRRGEIDDVAEFVQRLVAREVEREREALIAFYPVESDPADLSARECVENAIRARGRTA